jgi:Asp-tRNA(Asn)/Glu-tRNA(Gln) amidotransferase A subunit family amidase
VPRAHTRAQRRAERAAARRRRATQRRPKRCARAGRLLDLAGVARELARGALPTPTQANALYTEHVAANADELLAGGELPLAAGLSAIALGLLSQGRLDRRVHPNTALLLAGVFALRALYRDKRRTERRVAAARAAVDAVWRAGTLVVSPTSTLRPPRHGRTAFATRLMSFCRLGNLVDATGLAIPFGVFPGAPALPRSLQILGPSGSEDAVLDLGARLAAAM